MSHVCTHVQDIVVNVVPEPVRWILGVQTVGSARSALVLRWRQERPCSQRLKRETTAYESRLETMPRQTERITNLPWQKDETTNVVLRVQRQVSRLGGRNRGYIARNDGHDRLSNPIQVSRHWCLTLPKWKNAIDFGQFRLPYQAWGRQGGAKGGRAHRACTW